MAFGQLGATGALVGGPLGAAVGLGLDTLLAGQQNKAAKKDYERFAKFQLESFSLQSEALQAKLFEQQVNLARAGDRLERNARLGLNLFRASAFASGVQGNTVNAISRTKLIQEGEVRAQLAQQFKNIDANYDRQSRALALQTKINLTNAAVSAKAQMTSIFDVVAGLGATAGSLYQIGAFDKNATATDLVDSSYADAPGFIGPKP